jgi:hypothetical protein
MNEHNIQTKHTPELATALADYAKNQLKAMGFKKTKLQPSAHSASVYMIYYRHEQEVRIRIADHPPSERALQDGYVTLNTRRQVRAYILYVAKVFGKRYAPSLFWDSGYVLEFRFRMNPQEKFGGPWRPVRVDPATNEKMIATRKRKTRNRDGVAKGHFKYRIIEIVPSSG